MAAHRRPREAMQRAATRQPRQPQYNWLAPNKMRMTVTMDMRFGITPGYPYLSMGAVGEARAASPAPPTRGRIAVGRYGFLYNSGMVRWLLLAASIPGLYAQTGENVLLVVNRRDPVSAQVAAYYQPRRMVPAKNVCTIDTAPSEAILWQTYEREIERPVGECLKKGGLTEQVLYIVLTMGTPLSIDGGGSTLEDSEHSSVDSELALLYGKLKGAKYPRRGTVPNPFFMQRDAPFRHPLFPIYLVTRLGGNDFADVKGMIDRSLYARNRGKFVIDVNTDPTGAGNNWLRNAAMLLPADRVIVDETDRVLYDQQDVIGYASWGSNDHNRKRRWLGFLWLPGAIATEFVSSNARTLKRPPGNWGLSSWSDPQHWFAGSGQSLSADTIHEGASGVSGNVYEPFLVGCARPDLVLPAYFEGRNLAESFYLGLPFLSWQGVVLGDPLMSIGRPGR